MTICGNYFSLTTNKLERAGVHIKNKISLLKDGSNSKLLKLKGDVMWGKRNLLPSVKISAGRF